ncbi:MAG: DUF1801 domain-containing protein [Cytophagia bacterium]|nr:DUF1801 domain-containing protein [Cytophagia bacterium]
MNLLVTKFLTQLNHPFAVEIDTLRKIILDAQAGIEENIKWNGPNYVFQGDDRVTMRIHPPKKQVQLIFHLRAKKQDAKSGRIIEDQSGLLDWKGNDRAIVTYKSLEEIENTKAKLQDIVNTWLEAGV